jgi:hypothetical protein
VPDRWHSAKKENNYLTVLLTPFSSLTLSFLPSSLPAPPRLSARRRDSLPAAAPSARRRGLPTSAPCCGRAPGARRAPHTQAPTRLLAAAAARRAGLLGRARRAVCPPPPRGRARRTPSLVAPPPRHRRYKLCVFILFICVFIGVFMNLCMFICCVFIS